MKMLKQLALILLCPLFIFTSCENNKEAAQLEQEVEAELREDENYITEFTIYVDGEQVEESEIELNYEDYFILLETGEKDDPNAKIRRINAFTTQEAMMAYGDEVGIPVRLSEEIAAHLRTYAVETGAIDIYEETGEVPEEYLAYMDAYVESMSPNVTEPQEVDFRTVGVIYKEPFPGGGSWLYTSPGFAVMPFTWNNRVSRYEHFNAVPAFHVFYDKPFFFESMFAHWPWGFDEISFIGPLKPIDNKTSSMFVL